MTFHFDEITVSGARFDTEGTSKGIKEISRVMTNYMGWTTHDDRTNQAGANHKMVLRSTGEDPGPAFYLVMTSGDNSGSVAPPQDVISFQISTFWDASTHTVGSGVITPANPGVAELGRTDSDGFYTLWVSGDKDSVVIVGKARNNYNRVGFGRGENFLSPDYEPYGLYMLGGTGNTAIDPFNTSIRSVVGNPPTAITAANDGAFRSVAFSSTNEPRRGLNPSEIVPIFTAVPLVFFVEAAASTGAISIVKNMWGFLPATIGYNSETVLVSSGTDREYMVFGDTSNGLLIRRT